MKKQLEMISKSYDDSIKFGKKGINPYDNLPEHIVNHSYYSEYLKLSKEVGSSDSKRKEIKTFLQANSSMKFIDLGCCLNLMFNDYDKWPSLYHGIDISKETIDLLNEVVDSRQLSIGSLHCGSIDDIPYEDCYFDIGACIGVLEYFDESFLTKAMIEIHRVLKVKGRVVIDIPNIDNPVYEINRLIEKHIGRPSEFNISKTRFNIIIEDYFNIVKTENVVGMVQYFLEKK